MTEPELTIGGMVVSPLPLLGSIFKLVIMPFGAYNGVGTLYLHFVSKKKYVTYEKESFPFFFGGGA